MHAGGELSGASNAEAFHYDGTSWTGGGNINQTRNVLGGYGTQTSGAIVGGHMDPTPTTVQNVHETYDGTTWSEAGDLQTGRAYFGTAGCGTTTAALVMAGLINPELNPHPFGAVGAKNESEEYNGTSWAEGNNVNTARARKCENQVFQKELFTKFWDIHDFDVFFQKSKIFTNAFLP